ncbi:MAG TPA: hypothetical protein VMS17_26600 [Gemmataceae bacterium]|nr:hypothetical protein [Gemmataceae bacterium]
MSVESLFCPYCNALLPEPNNAAVGQRVTCPRCGEAFTVLRPAPGSSTGVQQTPPAHAIAAAARLDVQRRFGAGGHKTMVAAVVVGVMAVMAAIGLVYALHTTGQRRAYDTALPPPARRSPLLDLPAPTPVVTPPAALEGLRWLPPNTTLIAGVQLAEMRQTDAGLKLMHQSFSIGSLEFSPSRLEGWTGLKVQEIDHVVIGVQADEPLPPPAVMVVRTIHPYDPSVVKGAVGAEPNPLTLGGKRVFQGKLHDLGQRVYVWFADDRTILMALWSKHLESVPDRPAAGLERLPAAVRNLLQTRLAADGPMWVVGHSGDWRQTAAAVVLAALPKKDADLAGHVHDFALQLRAEEPMTLAAVLGSDGEDAARRLEARLAAAKPAEADWKAAREGQWLTLQVRGEPMALFRDLGK